MNRFLANAPRFFGPLFAAVAVATAGTRAHAQTATDIVGIYNTGETSTGNLITQGTTDSAWTVTYASLNGGTNYANSSGTAQGLGTYSAADSTYVGASYVADSTYISSSAYTQNTSNAQWVTAPGAYDSTGPNTGLDNGGLQLPGNGTTGSNEGVYYYTLAFVIDGTGTQQVTTVTSQVQISMTLAADDTYSVYVNPAGKGQKEITSAALFTRTAAWTNTTAILLQNFTGSGGSNNTSFVIGTNYITIAVDNTNGAVGNSSNTAFNASGLLVYATDEAEINGKPVPEVYTWLPLFGAIGCYGLIVLRRRQAQLHAARA